MGLDGRIGKEFLKAGLGWGGSCFPKDVLAIKKLGDTMGHPMPLVTASMEMNRRARTRVADRIAEKLGNTLEGKKIAVLGVAFKNNTDDTRESPAIDLIRSLEGVGAIVVAHDPVARLDERHGTRAEQVDDIFEAAQGADAVVIATEWEAFRAIDLPKLKGAMRGDVLADARNLLDRSVAEAVGFRVIQVGR
jgi:UDPglucose 6-dehydrogenase